MQADDGEEMQQCLVLMWSSGRTLTWVKRSYLKVVCLKESPPYSSVKHTEERW